MGALIAGAAGRRDWMGTALALGMLAALSLVTYATAREPQASGPLKGQWDFDVETATGHLPMTAAFRGSEQGGGGVLLTPGGSVEVQYRQDGAAFSVSAEIPGSSSPTGSGQSLLLRGTQTSESAATGSVMLIGDRPGDNGVVTFEVIPGTFSATRQ